MNKVNLISAIAKESDIPKTQAGSDFEAFCGAVTEALKGGEKVNIMGLGLFEAKKARRNQACRLVSCFQNNQACRLVEKLEMTRDEEGFVSNWDEIQVEIAALAISTEDTDPKSYDPTITFNFADGSDLDVANPRQAAYAGGLTASGQYRIGQTIIVWKSGLYMIAKAERDGCLAPPKKQYYRWEKKPLIIK